MLRSKSGLGAARKPPFGHNSG